MKSKKNILFLFIIGALLFPQKIFAFSNNPNLPTVTVINPIRGHELGLENVDLLVSLKAQWEATKNVGIPATWLWQYSAFTDNSLIHFAKSEMDNQEFGIFLEIDKNTAEKAGVRYRGKGPWYHSDGLFLTSYEVEDRKKIIDTIFESFKKTFGYYPKTVGAWWVGADSIQYMQKKYGITGVLQCADQFETDKYSIWGTPWSIPYLPSRNNSAKPAASFPESIPGVIVMQWATRDPVMAYGNSVNESTYSIQDFAMKKYSTDAYLTYLKNIYLHKPLDQIVIGLEGGFSGYNGNYMQGLQVIKKWEIQDEIKLQTAASYAGEFIKARQILPPTHFFLSHGYQGSNQSFWYHSTNYRLAIHKIGEKIYLTDFRDYLNTPEEEFYNLPNTQPLLRVNTRALIDSARNPEQRVILADFQKGQLTIKESNDHIELASDGKFLAFITPAKITFFNLPKESIKIFPNNYKVRGDKIVLEINKNIDIFFLIPFVFLLSIGLYFLYDIFRKTENNLNKLLGIFCFLFSLFILFPIFSSGQFYGKSMGFTTISLALFPVLSFIRLGPSVKVFLVYQFIPAVLLISIHFLLTHKIKRQPIILGIYFILTLAFFYTLNNFSQIFFLFLFNGKKAKVVTLIGIFTVGLVIFLLYRLYQLKKDKLLSSLIIVCCISIALINTNSILSRKSFIISPFEINILNQVYKQHKNVLYLMPDFNAENYQNTTPLIAADSYYPGVLTSSLWEKVHVNIKESDINQKNILVVVPRYLGSEFEAKDLFHKIFDNAQIAIYKK